MTIETRIRETLRNKLNIAITRRKRGPFCVVRPDGKQTQHKTKREALNRMLAEVRCMNALRWQVAVLLKEKEQE